MVSFGGICFLRRGLQWHPPNGQQPRASWVTGASAQAETPEAKEQPKEGEGARRMVRSKQAAGWCGNTMTTGSHGIWQVKPAIWKPWKAQFWSRCFVCLRWTTSMGVDGVGERWAQQRWGLRGSNHWLILSIIPDLDEGRICRKLWNSWNHVDFISIKKITCSIFQ